MYSHIGTPAYVTKKLALWGKLYTESPYIPHCLSVPENAINLDRYSVHLVR